MNFLFILACHKCLFDSGVRSYLLMEVDLTVLPPAHRQHAARETEELIAVCA